MATSVQLKACGGVGPYTWTKTGNIKLVNNTGKTVTVVVLGTSGGGVEASGVACVLPEIAYNYVNAGNCASGGNLPLIAGIIGGAPKYGCDGSTISGSALALYTRGTLTWTLTGGVNCADFGSQPLYKSSNLPNFSNNAVGGTGSDAPSDLSPVQLRIQFVPFAGGASFDETFTLNLGPDQLIIGTNKIDVRTAQMIADGCTGCCNLTGATATVTDATGVSATFVF